MFNNQQLHFRLWMESQINRDSAKRIVLDALDIPQDSENMGDVLGTPLRQRPEIAQKLNGFAELKPYMTTITAWIRGNGTKTLQQLIDYIDSLDNPKEPDQTSQQSLQAAPPVAAPQQQAF